jgi:uncharacterized damage-inducible protein DinB
METLATLVELFRYGEAANGLVVNAAGRLTDEQLDRPLNIGLGSIRRICQHLLAGEATWLARIRGDVEAAWPDELAPMSMPDVLRHLEAVETERRSFLAALQPEQLSRRQRYRDSKGSLFQATLHEMLIQAAVHAIHHRAQITCAIQLVGGNPPEPDYMHSVRKPT